MTLGLLFWILMLIALVCGWPGNPWLGGRPWVNNLLLFLLLGVLGWAVFGAAIKG